MSAPSEEDGLVPLLAAGGVMNTDQKKNTKKLTLNVETIRNISELGTGNAQPMLTSPRCTDSSCPFTTCA
jgi:hypothetical protein